MYVLKNIVIIAKKHFLQKTIPVLTVTNVSFGIIYHVPTLASLNLSNCKITLTLNGIANLVLKKIARSAILIQISKKQ